VGGAGLLAFVSLAVPIGIVSLVVVARLVRGDRSLIPTFNASRWRSMIRAILPYSIAVAASTVYFRIAVVLTAILASAHASGLFNASFRMTEVLTAIPALVAGTGLPIFARAARDDLARLGYGLSRVFEVSLALGVWFALSIAIGAHLAFTLIGGLPKYAGAPRVLAVQGVALGGTFVSAVGAYGMLSLNLNRAILAVNAGALGGSIVLMAVLIPADGGQGAALAMAIGEITAAIVSFLVLGRRSPALRPPLRVMPRVALAAAVGASPVLIGGLPIIVRLVISSLLYLAVLLLTGALPRELVDALPGRVSAHLMPTRRERPHR
jgi:O-antigen/teichoic acid export membrane protein